MYSFLALVQPFAELFADFTHQYRMIWINSEWISFEFFIWMVVRAVSHRNVTLLWLVKQIRKITFILIHSYWTHAAHSNSPIAFSKNKKRKPMQCNARFTKIYQSHVLFPLSESSILLCQTDCNSFRIALSYIKQRNLVYLYSKGKWGGCVLVQYASIKRNCNCDEIVFVRGNFSEVMMVGDWRGTTL